MKSGSHLEKVLTGGHFALTCEISPPRGTNAGVIKQKVQYVKEKADAVNVMDNALGMVQMSSWGASLFVIQEGVEPVYQMVCRDRNRLAMQSDILGACAHGIKNMLCLSGDHQQFGDHPQTKGVFDIDSIQLINMVKNMRDEGKFLNGQEIDEPPQVFIGAAAHPSAEPVAFRVHRLAKKIAAGVDFIQTQAIYNMAKFQEWLQQAADMGLSEKVYILPSIRPLKSLDMARQMKEKLDLPDEIIKRIQDAGEDKYEETGIQIACEQIEKFRQMKGVAGIHLMAGEDKIPEIAERAKLLPRPKV